MTHIRTLRFLASLIVLGKWEVCTGLQIYPKKILRRTNKTHKALEKDTRVSKVLKARRQLKPNLQIEVAPHQIKMNYIPPNNRINKKMTELTKNM